MGHCVGGYCPDVLEGKSRIFSLRSGKGEPHVTIEIQPGRREGERAVDYRQLLPENYAAKYGDDSDLLDRIVQIKGKANRAPNPEYLPFVQDFVKSGKWSDVGDLQNTGLIRHPKTKDLITRDELSKGYQYHNEDTGEWEDIAAFAENRWPGRPGDQDNFIMGALQGDYVRPTPPEPGYAAGGVVETGNQGYNPSRIDELVNSLSAELYPQ